jgi:hypothetical protein
VDLGRAGESSRSNFQSVLTRHHMSLDKKRVREPSIKVSESAFILAEASDCSAMWVSVCAVPVKSSTEFNFGSEWKEPEDSRRRDQIAAADGELGAGPTGGELGGLVVSASEP